MPLLDVVFLLLTFFAFALLVMVRAEVLDVELPVIEAGRTTEQRGTPVVVSIVEDGSLAIDREPVEDAVLVEQLQMKRSESEDAGSEFTLLLEVDVGSPSGRLIELVQTLRQAGFDRFGVLGSSGDQPPAA
ncbi:MAG: biopolymer transporter ExbD, partial [Planctomycetota bacterium]